MNIESLFPQSSRTSYKTITYARVQQLVEWATDDGVLTREEDEVIMAAITHSDRPTAEMCRLFRELQEQVWDGELILEGRRHR